MTVATWLQPNFTNQSATVYKSALDGGFAVLHRIAGAFAPHEVTTGSPAPAMAVEVDAGFVFDGTVLTEVGAQTVSGFTIPAAGQHRIDRVVIDEQTGEASRVAGTAVTGSPSAVPPAIPAGKLPCCSVLLPGVGAGIISNFDITDERVGVPVAASKITLDTEQTAASGSPAPTLRDFAIPSGVKRVVVMLENLSTNNSDNLLVQLGDSGGIENSGYESASSRLTDGGAVVVNNRTDGFNIAGNSTAADLSGALVLERMNDSHKWVAHGSFSGTAAALMVNTAGSKTLSAELTTVRLTTSSGTSVFDAGAVNVSSQR